jgi:hypothetical protein
MEDLTCFNEVHSFLQYRYNYMIDKLRSILLVDEWAGIFIRI